MKKPETALVEKIIDRLKAEGGFWVKIHGGPMQQAGIPDIIGCYHKRFVGIEVKVGDNKPSKLQKIVLDELLQAGSRCGVAYTLSQALGIRDGDENWGEQRQKL